MKTDVVRVFSTDKEWIETRRNEGETTAEVIHRLVLEEHNKPFDALEMENRKLNQLLEEREKQNKLLREIIEDMRSQA